MLQDLNEHGVETMVVKGDVSVKEDVFAMVRQASCRRKIKGIIHAAMVLEVRSPLSIVSHELTVSSKTGQILRIDYFRAIPARALAQGTKEHQSSRSHERDRSRLFSHD